LPGRLRAPEWSSVEYVKRRCLLDVVGGVVGGMKAGRARGGGEVFQLPTLSQLQGSLPAWPTTVHF